jgi:carboxypeptidase Q
MLKKASLVLASALVLITSAQAQSIHKRVAAEATALRDQAMHDTIAYDLVESLTMEVGPRSAGSAGDKAAIAWAVDKLKELGFENVHAGRRNRCRPCTC